MIVPIPCLRNFGTVATLKTATTPTAWNEIETATGSPSTNPI
ncbi:MAG: hypothetical protein ACFFFH_17340 [Candidatus Thorarchaeota archaeon]